MPDYEDGSGWNRRFANVDHNRNPVTDWRRRPKQPRGYYRPNYQLNWYPYRNKEDFLKKINFWIWECQQWKQFHTNYPTLPGLNPQNTTLRQSLWSNNPNTNANNNSGQTNNQTNSTPIPQGQGTVYKLPRLWKRIVAELIDCFLLLVVKLILVFVLMDEYLGKLSPFEEIMAAMLDSETEDRSTQFLLMLENSGKALALALIHRIIVCLYETYSLYAYPNPNFGGATFGKMVLGLRVVSSQTIEDLGDGRIRVWPAGNIGFTNSLVRAVIKNSSIVFYLPSYASLLGSQFNRTAYDFMCSCVVVETIPNNQPMAN